MVYRSIAVLLALGFAGCGAEMDLPGDSSVPVPGPAPTAEATAHNPEPTADVAAPAPNPTPAAASMPAGSIRLERVEIYDRAGFEKALVAVTALLPSGWRSEGGVVWNPQAACGSGYQIDFRATSTDGMSGVHFFPAEAWEWNNTGTPTGTGCLTLQIGSVREYLESTVAQARPGARVLEFRPRPDIAAEFRALEQTTPMPMGESRTWVEAGEVEIVYQADGVDVREVVASAATFNLMRMQSMAPGFPDTEYLNASTFTGFAMRAPAGELNRKLAETIRLSAKATPDWSARIAQHNATIAGIQIKGARDRARITAETNEQIREMQQDSWRRYNESSDRNAREFSEYIRDVETYNDPFHGGTVELDSSYEHAWQLDDGSYVLTDDPSFNPYSATGQGGQELTPTR